MRYLSTHASKAGIPVMGWEPDNNFVVDYHPIKNWIGVDWNKFDTTYYPSGGEARARSHCRFVLPFILVIPD